MNREPPTGGPEALAASIGPQSQKFIVAEVSKNWPRANYIGQVPPEFCICGQFEHVIEVNRSRGYRLHSWQLHRVMTDAETMNETIIAVFEAVTLEQRLRGNP